MIDMESLAESEFRVLGAVQAWAGGTQVRLAGPRQERILAALLVEAERVVSVSALVDVVWDGEPPATAERQVRNLATALRRTLVAAGFPEDVVTASGHGFVARPPSLDLRLFEHHVAARRYRSALELWRGPALDGITSTALRAAAAGLEERRLSVLELCLTADVDEGRHREAVAELAVSVAEHPLREGLVAAYMRALYLCGRQADALTAFHSAQTLLSEELGVDPGPALRALHQKILREEIEVGAADHSSAGLSFLPYDVPDFTGRESELIQIRAAIAAGVPVTLHGMAGVGKTSLAVHAAHRLAQDFPDGRLFLDLHGFTPGREPLSTESALEALLVQIGVTPVQIPPEVDARAALWRSRTAGRRLLVLLDNAVDDEQVLPLLPGSPGVALIATSRRQLAAIDGAASVPVEVLPDADAVALFEAVAGQSDAGVVELCGRLPLAIRIAAARLQHRPQWTAEWLARRLGVEHRRLAELRIGGRDVAAAFALSYRDLGPDRQHLFRALGQHPGDEFGRAAAAAAADLAEAAAGDLLEDLLDASLLQQGSAPDRYGFHNLLAEHARDIVEEDDADAAFDRLVAYYASGGSAEWHAAERANLVAISLAAFRRGRDEAVPRLASHAVPYLRERGYRDDFLAVTEAAVAAARRSGDERALQASLGDRMLACWDGGLLDDALEAGDEQLLLARRQGDVPAETLALARLGAILGMLGEAGPAMEHLEQALLLATETGDHAGFAVAAGNLSNQHLAAGRIEEALATAQAAQAAREAGGDEAGLVLARAQLGLVLAHRGQHREGLVQARAAVGEAESSGYLFGEAYARIDLADILLLLEQPSEAREQAERACAILRRLNNPLLAAMAANSLGAACRALGRSAAALTQHRLALETARRIGYRAEEVRALAGIEAAGIALAGR